MKNDEYKFYLRDLGTIIKEEAIKAKEKSNVNDNDFNKGFLMAYYNVVSLLKQQAQAFNIDLKDLNLQNFDENKKLLS